MAVRLNMLIGCTASGKSGVALLLAERLGAEILSIDSMKIYRGMDVGTAKPGPAERARVPHHMIDIVDPWESYSLGRFLEDADRAIAGIHARGRPIVAEGGTMMFVRGLVSGVFEGPGADADFRRRLRERAAREGTARLHAELTAVDPEAAARIHVNDLRRIERALEVYHLSGRPISALQTQWEQSPGRYDCRLVALVRGREDLHRRINRRVRQMVAAGLADEVRRLMATPGGIGPQAAQAVGYAEMLRYLAGQIDLERAVEEIKIHTRQLAKHQRTWMRRMPGVRLVHVGPEDRDEDIADRVAALWDEL